MMPRTLQFALLLVLTAVAATPAAAQQARMPGVEDIVRQLTQPQISEKDLRNNAVAVEGRRTRVEQGPSIDLAVNFEYASANLTADARIVLDNLGQALNDPALRDSRIRVAGHTDARGGDAYNLALSRQRARSVADYLARVHGVEARRLTVEGFGRTQLLDPANPESAVNRRVQITNLGS
jgi:outer membrane protein OmpA-like peptidoglycan-associated protein